MKRWIWVGLAVAIIVMMLPIAVAAGSGSENLGIFKEAIKGLVELAKLQYCADNISVLCP